MTTLWHHQKGTPNFGKSRVDPLFRKLSLWYRPEELLLVVKASIVDHLSSYRLCKGALRQPALIRMVLDYRIWVNPKP